MIMGLVTLVILVLIAALYRRVVYELTAGYPRARSWLLLLGGSGLVL